MDKQQGEIQEEEVLAAHVAAENPNPLVIEGQGEVVQNGAAQEMARLQEIFDAQPSDAERAEHWRTLMEHNRVMHPNPLESDLIEAQGGGETHDDEVAQDKTFRERSNDERATSPDVK